VKAAELRLRIQLPPANWFVPPVNNAEARAERVLVVSESFENCRFPVLASYPMKDCRLRAATDGVLDGISNNALYRLRDTRNADSQRGSPARLSGHNRIRDKHPSPRRSSLRQLKALLQLRERRPLSRQGEE
jgi:hypothetical protein